MRKSLFSSDEQISFPSYMVYIVWIQTQILWFRKRPRCQLCQTIFQIVVPCCNVRTVAFVANTVCDFSLYLEAIPRRKVPDFHPSFSS